MAGFGGVDSLDTPARCRNAGDRERRTDAGSPRLVGDPRVAIDQRYISDERRDRIPATADAVSGLRERNLFLVLLNEPVMPDAIQRFAGTVKVLQRDNRNQLFIGTDMNTYRLHGITELSFNSKSGLARHGIILVPVSPETNRLPKQIVPAGLISTLQLQSKCATTVPDGVKSAL